jgi:hypothetical protein
MATAPKRRFPNVVPSLENWGGIRTRLKHRQESALIKANREQIAWDMLAVMGTSIRDVMTWDEDGQVKIKASRDISDTAIRAIKSVKVRRDKDGNETLEVELFDKVAVMRILAKAAGLLEQRDDADRPSVIGITVQPPDVTDIEPPQ